jgi:hypothetical protein
MTDQFTRQVQEILAAAKDASIPENVKALAEDSVAKTRDAYSKMSSAARDSARIFENVVVSAQAGANSITRTSKLIYIASATRRDLSSCSRPDPAQARAC